MLKAKKVISAFLALLMAVSLCSSISFTTGAAAAPDSRTIALSVPNDVSYIDTSSSNTSGLFWEDKWRGVEGTQTVTYMYDLPDNTVNISSIQAYQAFGGINGKLEISNDKTNWKQATTTDEGGMAWITFTPQAQDFLSNNASKTIYVKVTHTGSASSFLYTAFNLNYQTGEEPSYSATFAAGTIEDTGRVFYNTEGGNASVSNGQWNIWGGGYVTYRLDLPNDAISFCVNAVCWGNVVVNVSKDNENWTETYNNANTPQQVNVIGSSYNGGFLTDNPEKVIYVKISTGNVLAMTSFGYKELFTEPAYSGTFNVSTPAEDLRLFESSVSIIRGENQKSCYGAFLTYRLDLPNDTDSFNINACFWGGAKVSISKDNTTWTKTYENPDFDQSVYIVGKSSDGDFLSNNQEKVIFIKFETIPDVWLAIRSVGFSAKASLKLNDYAITTDSQLGPTTDAVLVLGESKGLIDTEFVDSATDVSFWNPPWALQNYWRLIQNNTTSSLIYKVDLPDTCSNVNFNTFNDGGLVVEVSKDKSNWVSTTTSENAGLVSYYFTPSNQSFLEDNPTKVIYIKINSSDVDGSIIGGFYVEYNMNNRLTRVAPGKTAEEFIAQTMPSGAEYEVLKPPYGENDDLLPTDKLGTGCVVKYFVGNAVSTFTIVMYGDVSGDGEIGVMDLIAMKNHMLKSASLTGAYITSADVSKDGTVTIIDLLAVKDNILKNTPIEQ